jgi:YVTN family beta-propeller protein
MVYVANFSDNSVSVIDGSTNTVAVTIKGFSAPYGVAVNSVTNQVFVSNSGLGTVSVIDGTTNLITATVVVGSSPAGVRVNSTANLAYVVSAGPGTVSVIDGQSDTVVNTFNLPQGAEPNLVAFDPIANRLFVTNGLPAVVYVLDADSGTLLATITGGKAAFEAVNGIVLFQPGKSILISDRSLNAVVQVNESTYAATAGLKGGNGPAGIAVNRKTGNIYVTETGNGTVNVYTQPK